MKTCTYEDRHTRHMKSTNAIMCLLFAKKECVCRSDFVRSWTYMKSKKHTKMHENVIMCVLFVTNVCVCVDVILYALYTHEVMHTRRMKSKKHTRSMKMTCTG